MNEPRLYILCGLRFAGKTTLAKGLFKKIGFVLIDIDQINTNFGVGLSGTPISQEEQVIYYRQSEPLDEWILQDFKRTNH